MHGCEGHPVCGWWLRFQECKRLLSTCHWRAPVVMVWRVSVGLPGGCFCFGWVVGLGLAGFCGPLGRVPLLRVGGWPRVGCGGCGDAVSHFHCFSRLKRAKMNPSPDPADPADPPDPADPVHGLPPGTSPTRAGGQDDVSSQANSLKHNNPIVCCQKKNTHILLRFLLCRPSGLWRSFWRLFDAKGPPTGTKWSPNAPQFTRRGVKMNPKRAGRGLKRSLEAVGFVLAEFQPKRSHGDPIRDIFSVNLQDATSRNIIDEQNLFF